MPVAIQLYQGQHNPVIFTLCFFHTSEISFVFGVLSNVAQAQEHVSTQVFTPDIDEHKWTLVKMWANTMESVFHQVVFHLGAYSDVFLSEACLLCLLRIHAGSGQGRGRATWYLTWEAPNWGNKSECVGSHAGQKIFNLIWNHILYL